MALTAGARKRQVIYRNLTNSLILFFLINLLALNLLPLVSGCTPGPLRLPAQATTQGASQGPGGTSDEKNVYSLEPSQPIKRDLANGQEHIYRIRLSADQYLKAVVEQQSINLAVQVLRPDGKQIFMIDSESRLERQEEVSLMAWLKGGKKVNSTSF